VASKGGRDRAWLDREIVEACEAILVVDQSLASFPQRAAGQARAAAVGAFGAMRAGTHRVEPGHQFACAELSGGWGQGVEGSGGLRRVAWKSTPAHLSGARGKSARFAEISPSAEPVPVGGAEAGRGGVGELAEPADPLSLATGARGSRTMGAGFLGDRFQHDGDGI
jgi:hypothetical protein